MHACPFCLPFIYYFYILVLLCCPWHQNSFRWAQWLLSLESTKISSPLGVYDATVHFGEELNPLAVPWFADYPWWTVVCQHLSCACRCTMVNICYLRHFRLCLLAVRGAAIDWRVAYLSCARRCWLWFENQICPDYDSSFDRKHFLKHIRL